MYKRENHEGKQHDPAGTARGTSPLRHHPDPSSQSSGTNSWRGELREIQFVGSEVDQTGSSARASWNLPRDVSGAARGCALGGGLTAELPRVPRCLRRETFRHVRCCKQRVPGLRSWRLALAWAGMACASLGGTPSTIRSHFPSTASFQSTFLPSRLLCIGHGRRECWRLGTAGLEEIAGSPAFARWQKGLQRSVGLLRPAVCALQRGRLGPLAACCPETFPPGATQCQGPWILLAPC